MTAAHFFGLAFLLEFRIGIHQKTNAHGFRLSGERRTNSDSALARIMHHAERFARLSGGSRAGNPSGWIGVSPLAVQRVWD